LLYRKNCHFVGFSQRSVSTVLKLNCITSLWTHKKMTYLFWYCYKSSYFFWLRYNLNCFFLLILQFDWLSFTAITTIFNENIAIGIRIRLLLIALPRPNGPLRILKMNDTTLHILRVSTEHWMKTTDICLAWNNKENTSLQC
jgi:hypothetical protein